MRIFAAYDPAIIGRPPDLGVPPTPENFFVDVEEIIRNGGTEGGSGSAVGLGSSIFVNSSQQTANFTFGATTIAAISTRPIPKLWQGKDVGLWALISHNAAGLTGGGSPPDDQVAWEIGWETMASSVAYADLSHENDGTAPHEQDTNVQIGTVIDQPIYRLLATIPIGAADEVIHFRVTRDANDADDGLAATLEVLGFFLGVVP